jgi:signal transduction histidine kinase
MFSNARIKLTAWYLLIIMLVSIMFSTVIYLGASHELSRIERVQKARPQELAERLAPPVRTFRIDPEVLEESRSRVRLALIMINMIILGFSGTAGYFLAGRTLGPIEEMIDEQNKFITGASHELRTPLTALKTSTEVGLRDKNLTITDAKSLLRGNLEEVENLKILSDNLLRLSQFEQVNGDIVMKSVPVAEILAEAMKKVNTLAREKGIAIELPKEKTKVRGDKGSLVELMVILFDNAIKYSPKGSKIKVFADSHDRKVSIKVKDMGMGIDEKDIKHIFDRFYRGDKARSKENISGYGLGLSIAKKTAGLHGGTVEVESKVGKGSTFTITLPCES